MSARIDARTARITAAVDANASDLLAYLARRVDQPEDAADLLSETFLVLWRRASSLPEADSELRPWIFGIARKILLRHYRHSTKQRAISDRLRSILLVVPHPGFADPTEHSELHDAISRLDPVDRDIIGLVHWEGFSLVEVSRIVAMKEGTVRSRYHRARTSLRSQLQQEREDQPALPVPSD